MMSGAKGMHPHTGNDLRQIYSHHRKGGLPMSQDYSFKDRIKDIINGTTDFERNRKASMQGQIDRADHIFQFLLLLFGLGFWIVMLIRYFL